MWSLLCCIKGKEDTNYERELPPRLQQYIQWKLEHNKLIIDSIKIAQYLNITLDDAENIIDNLLQWKILKASMKIGCPICQYCYSIQDIDGIIECYDCGESFIPKANKQLICYYYKINKESEHAMKEKKPRKTSIKSKIERYSPTMKNKKVKVFLSYSHKDEQCKKALVLKQIIEDRRTIMYLVTKVTTKHK